MKVLVLGHHGMLGNAVYKYLNKCKHEVLSIEGRWPNATFLKCINDSKADVIINCIGAIPQKYGSESMYSLNVKLPVFLDKVGVPIIHPSTDCEFAGNLIPPLKYRKGDKRDVGRDDIYGDTKATASLFVEKVFHNTKAIRTSIIGHEEKEGKSLMDWFLNCADDAVSGYDNAYWNGITTLQWAWIAEKMILEWDYYGEITQVGTEGLTKYQLLCVIKDVYRKDIEINRVLLDKPINKMLKSDFSVPPIRDQLVELKFFYDR